MGLGVLLFALGLGFALLLIGRALMGAGVALALVDAVRVYQLACPLTWAPWAGLP